MLVYWKLVAALATLHANFYSLNPNLNILATDVSENMIQLAKSNNPTAQHQILDARKLHTLNQSFDGIVCGFIIPYLSSEDLSTFLTNCAQLLHPNGILYLSFVEGDYKDSTFQTGSSGDRTFFYYHNLDTIKRILNSHSVEVTTVDTLEFEKSDGSIEKHTVLYGKKQEGN